MSLVLNKAIVAWGDTIPDWVRQLANAADETSQNQVAKKLGYTASLVSQVINNRYEASTDLIEQVVRGKLMAEMVHCPGLHSEIGTDVCLSWREKARNYSGHNPMRVQMYRACKGCDRFTGGKV